MGRRKWKSNAEIVQRTWNTLPSLLKDVGVDHSGGDIAMPEQLLNGANIGSALQQMGGERMAKGMGLMCLVRPARRTATLMALLMTLGST